MRLWLFCISTLAMTTVGPGVVWANDEVPLPTAIFDLGALVTPDLTARTTGKQWLERNAAFARPNVLEPVKWENGPIAGQNSHYTFFNHSGPHVDAPNHFGLGGGLDSYPITSFVGPLRVFDVTMHAPGHTVPVSVFEGQGLTNENIVVIYTAYRRPADDEYPSSIALSREAAEYLAGIPIRAFGTDSYSVASRSGNYPIQAKNEVIARAPVHEAFLAKSIPIYEALQNIDKLLGRDRLYFIGVPLKIQDGDGMLVRPVVFAY